MAIVRVVAHVRLALQHARFTRFKHRHADLVQAHLPLVFGKNWIDGLRDLRLLRLLRHPQH
jgi:hypothetical protein